ncbi:hypothetical protein FRC14_002336 [Serendipita sp. 396]|nr:hypothetical protein FRC14_002336 [Serendipita sp. 396]KAG8788623.1 hypothetical protein FRC15_003147 [Serendipita sp. 397]KAG8803921.1 hypothetical protein FRC16_002035 [Serendipita sp. 398]KAG8828089.1 hypothetical protein FRC19_009945 [Serendipita sp. 401]KAG8838904.1 hypothetical protein FRC18_002132 [Serendipita sp. 400]KAG8875251.1 hypothetical protein FRC20_004176 [Serendipita sp. 405]KAG9058400.1 hypothetical protein FS842_010126 [Serendipita sp. 407]
MCLDLVAKHFALCSSKTVAHSESPTQFTDGEGRSWLFLPKAEAADSPGQDDLESLLQTHTSRPKWTINSYNKGIIAQPTISPLIGTGRAAFYMLYTMTLRSPKNMPNTELYGWSIEDGRDWFKRTYEHKANIIAYEDILVVRNPTDNEIGGFISILRDEQPPGPSDAYPQSRLYVSDLLIFPQYRRKGLATALLHAAFERAKLPRDQASGGVSPTICLTVFCENVGAVAAYFKEGFKVDDIVWVIVNLDQASQA